MIVLDSVIFFTCAPDVKKVSASVAAFSKPSVIGKTVSVSATAGMTAAKWVTRLINVSYAVIFFISSSVGNMTFSSFFCLKICAVSESAGIWV